MSFYFFKSAIRNYRKYRLYTIINITGLSIAIALGILIYLYIQDELSYDGFHSNKSRIFRIDAKNYVYGNDAVDFPLEKDHSFRFVWLPSALAPTLSEEIPDIAEISRYSDDEAIVSAGDKAFNEKIVFVDPGFLKMFDFKMIEGDRNSVLNDLHDIVITPSIAKKYFGDEDPVGKALHLTIWDNKNDFVVTGIIQDSPGNSSFKFNILIRQELRAWYKEEYDNWNSFNVPVFIELAANTSREQFDKRLEVFKDKYFGKTIADERAKQKLPDSAKVFELVLQPLTKIHLDNKVGWFESSDITYSWILGGIGFLIFIIACLNYISLSVSSAGGRTTEIGIRKVLGARKSSLAGNFWGESQLLAFISLVVGIVLAFILVDPFGRYAGKSLTMLPAFNFWFCLFLVITVFLTGVLAGGYPALFLSHFQPLEVLRLNRSGKYNLSFTRGLVILQYALSGILITSSLIMFRQMRFVTTHELGFNKEQVIVLPTYTGWTDEGERMINDLKNELKKFPEVKYVSGTNTSFNRGGWSRHGFEVNGKQHAAYLYRVDPDYIKTLGITIIDGRDFRSQNTFDANHAILVNEALVKDLGWDNPLGRHLIWDRDSVADEVVGVVKDYHFLGFTEKIQPEIIALSPAVAKITTALIKISPENMPGTLDKIEKEWKSLYPGKPFDYSFLDQDVDAQYSGYRRWMMIMSWATGLAIFIACLGLFGLAGISASNRTREISIRKVFGADISRLFILMNKEVILLAMISFIIAAPVSWYFMNKWLDTFAYRIGIPWLAFAAAAVSGILVAVLTVSYHSIKTALINPAKILKYE